MLGARLWGGLSSILNSRFPGGVWLGALLMGAPVLRRGFRALGAGLDYGADYAAVD